MTKTDDQRRRDLETFEHDGFSCVYCPTWRRDQVLTFEAWAFLQVDHFVPLTHNGTDDAANRVTACQQCDVMKGAELFATREDAKAKLARYWDGQRDY